MASSSATFLLPDPAPSDAPLLSGARARTPLVELARMLLPPGRAFTRRPDSDLGRLLAGLTDELGRIDALLELVGSALRDDDVGRWSRALGLDDTLSASVQRARIVARLVGEVDTSRAAYDAAALALGLTIVEVRTWLPFEVGRSSVGEPARGDAWMHDVRVVVTGGDAATRAALERVINQDLARAHTRVTVIAA